MSDAPAPLPFHDADLDALADRLADRLAGRPALPPPLLTQAQVAEWLSVSERTVDNLVAAGELIPLRVTPGGRGRRFERKTVQAFIRRSASGTASARRA